jgi:hypothetical protein
MLDFIADTLGKPKRALFGALAGRPEELLNLIPFSDTMGLTDPSKQVRGVDLAGGNELGGFALDILGDPLTWASGLGALKMGQAAMRFGRGASAVNPETARILAAADAASAASRAAPVSEATRLANWRSMMRPERGIAAEMGVATPPAGTYYRAREAAQMGFGRGGLLQDMATPDWLPKQPMMNEGFLQQLLANTGRPNLGLPTYY